MDIAATATSLSQARLSTQIGLAVAKKSLDAARQQGQAAIELLQAAAGVQAGGASPKGVGARIDVRG